MTKVLILYYSSYGHTLTMAKAVAEGVRGAGAEPAIRRVAETVPENVAGPAGYLRDQDAAVAEVNELPDYDGIILGSPTRYGNMAAQMKTFLDQTGSLWFQGKLIGKAGAAFTSTATQHGGQESTLLSMHTVMLHLGMVIVGLPYSFAGQMQLAEVAGGSPYGASTIAGPDGSRSPNEVELEGARFLGEHVARIAKKLAA